MKDYVAVAKEVIDGKWGNGTTRYHLLTEAGYDYDKVQDLVNKILRGEYVEEPAGEADKIMEINISLKEYKGIKLIFTD